LSFFCSICCWNIWVLADCNCFLQQIFWPTTLVISIKKLFSVNTFVLVLIKMAHHPCSHFGYNVNPYSHFEYSVQINTYVSYIGETEVAPRQLTYPISAKA
jgi:hypothetical protein